MVIKEAVGLMNFNDNEFANKALIKLLRNYINLKIKLDIMGIFILVKVFIQLELNDLNNKLSIIF